MKQGNACDDGMYILWEVSVALGGHHSDVVLIVCILREGNAYAEEDLGEGNGPEEIRRYGYGCGAHFGELALQVSSSLMTSCRRRCYEIITSFSSHFSSSPRRHSHGMITSSYLMS